MAWMAILWVLGAALVTLVIWALLKSTGVSAGTPKDSPERILERRYASGDIDRETYQQMRADLRGA